MQIKTALIGFGMSGKSLVAPFLTSNPAFLLHTICTKKNKDALDLFPAARLTHNYCDVIQDKEIDLVFITTPNTYHYDMALQALQAGKHVVVEKPFTVSYQEALTLIEESQKQKKMLSVYHNRRWDSCFLSTKAVATQGILGEIMLFEGHWNRYAPMIKGDRWRDQVRPGSGVLYDLGSHLLDQAVQLFGKPDSLFADIQKQRKGAVIDDYFDVQLFYHSRKIRLTASALCKNHRLRYVMHGTEGSYIKNGIDPQGEQLINGFPPNQEGWGNESSENYGTITHEKNGAIVEEPYTSKKGNWMSFFDNIAATIVHGGTPEVKAEEAAYTIYLIEKCFESKEKGMRIRC